MPKFLGYFERVLELNRARGGPWMVGARLSYADLSMAQVIAGLRYAFPSVSRRAFRNRPRLRALHDVVFDRPRIAHYVDRKSTRLNSSHSQISYAVFCLKKKQNYHTRFSTQQSQTTST